MENIIPTAVGIMASALIGEIGKEAYRSLKTYLCDKLRLTSGLEDFEQQPDSDEQQRLLAEALKSANAHADPEFERLVKAIRSELEKNDINFQSALRITTNEDAFITLGEVDVQGSAGINISENSGVEIKVGNIKTRP